MVLVVVVDFVTTLLRTCFELYGDSNFSCRGELILCRFDSGDFVQYCITTTTDSVLAFLHKVINITMSAQMFRVSTTNRRLMIKLSYHANATE